MQRFTSFSFSSSTFLNTPAELSLISCGQLCLSMHSGCFHSAHFWRVIYLLADLLISETHTHTKASQTHTPQARERKTCSARKQVDDQTGLTEAVWCLYRDLVLEICFTYSTLTALPLNSECEGDGYFRSEPGPVTQPFCCFKEWLPGTGTRLVLKKDLALIAQQYIFIGTPWHMKERRKCLKVRIKFDIRL